MLVDVLSDLEQAVLLAAALAGQFDASALQRVHGAAGERCRAALAELEASGSAERRRFVAASRRLFAPVPAHIERVHPSWLGNRLRAERGPLAALLDEAVPPGLANTLRPSPRRSDGSAVTAAVRAIACRAVLGDLPHLPAEQPRPAVLTTLRELPSWSTPRLLNLLRRLGVMGLAAWLGRAPDLARPLLARLPREEARALQDELRRGVGAPSLRWSPRTLGIDADLTVEDVIPLVGAELLGSGLMAAERRPVAVLLPRPLGESLLAASPGLDGELLLALVQRADKEAARP